MFEADHERQILESSFLSLYTWRWYYGIVAVVVASPHDENKTSWLIL